MNRSILPWLFALLLAVDCAGSDGTRADAPGTATDTAAGTDTAPAPGDAHADLAADAPGGSCAAIPPVAVDTARLTVDPGTGVLRDPHGREVVLRGLNAGGRAKFAPFLPFTIAPEAPLDEVRAAADRFFARFERWGLTAVRLTFSWEAMEPTRGTVDTRYLDRFEAVVAAAWDHRVRVVVDMHQDVFASPLCGDGFPPWALGGEPGPPRHDCPSWWTKYLSDPEVRAAFDRFWADEDGIRTAFYGAWETLATRLADAPGVVGFEILNEPSAGSARNATTFKEEVLGPFHTEIAGRLQAIAPDVLVFYDDPGVDAALADRESFHRPAGEGLVFAPHLYDPGVYMGVGWSGVAPEGFVTALAAFRAAEKVPVLIGEFGMEPGVPRGDEWLDAFLDLVDGARLSATLWEVSDDPELWNGEDFSVLEGDGTERAILDTYVRPWLRAVAGSDAAFVWDGAAGTAVAHWTADHGVTELALPPRLFPEGPRDLTVEGDGACATVDLERGELRVEAPPGTAVVVRFGR